VTPEAPWREEVQGRILAWFAAHRRPLPFRADRTPYRVLVAEVMLQQTRADTVGPFLERFLRRFPDPPALAAADEDDVLAAWQGLGYYRRARALRQAAQEMVARHGGRVPVEPDALRALPGVGPYIAAAVGAFAFGRDEAAADANVRRVVARLCDRERPEPELPAALLPPGRGADWNEALMDLGSLVCLPRAPRCAACPVEELCLGRRGGRAAELPARPPLRARPEVVVTALLCRDAAGRLALVRRPPRGLLAGFWELPSLEGASAAPEAAAAGWGLRLLGMPTPLPPFRHAFTHRVWDVRSFAAAAEGGAPAVLWAEEAELAALPLAGPSARVLRSAPAASVAGAPDGRAK
jgi:A/G-specific adenine glycosylase